MKNYKFESKLSIDKPIEQVFEFFSSAQNLNKVTPPHLNFRILNDAPTKISAGAIIDYRLKLYGIPIRWRSQITIWEPPHRFTDVQLKGPYKKWEHEHRFIQTEKGTLMIDAVSYEIPGWIFAPVLHTLFVRKDIEKIFSFRRRKFEQIFHLI